MNLLKCRCGKKRERTEDDYIGFDTFVCSECDTKNLIERENREKEQLYKQNFRNSKIPKMFLKFKDKFEFKEKYIKGIYCHGPVGTAKTTFLCCLGDYLCNQGSVIFTPTVNLLLKAQDVFKSDNKTIESEFMP